MIIVSDTGPLAYLVEIDVADSLPQLYGQVYIPPTVLSELRHESSPAFFWAHHLPDWVTTATPQAIPTDLGLDNGEREAIALALELHADFILMDEVKGREVARTHGLKVAGTLAVILDGDSQKLFDGVAALDKLKATTFYASAELLESVRNKLRKPRK